jgi:hypothetical protein
MAHNLAGTGEGAELRIRRMINEMLGGRLLQLALISDASNGRDASALVAGSLQRT